MTFETHEIANAKINLYLRVTNKRDDGYHELSSLMMFCDFGDEITISSSSENSLSITGEFSHDLHENEKSLDKNSSNILAKTLWALAEYTQETPSFYIDLDKKIPLGAGLGGGSANAAALARILCKYWYIDCEKPQFQKLLFNIGADVPACFYNKPCLIESAGENIEPAPRLFDLNALLIYPMAHSSTGNIFKNLNQNFNAPIKNPNQFENNDAFINFLKETDNDLKEPAIQSTPVIADALTALNKQANLDHANMSGSGSACFGIFKSNEDVLKAQEKIKSLHPTWWTQAVILNS